ncbi:hypothetical protein GQ53DRAFT_315807 [Thozetella sp. PMI_491]|nr:hypothetical protein GQ53DRAFT_315807 [Thozetella sp. PMI_491]
MLSHARPAPWLESVRISKAAPSVECRCSTGFGLECFSFPCASRHRQHYSYEMQKGSSALQALGAVLRVLTREVPLHLQSRTQPLSERQYQGAIRFIDPATGDVWHAGLRPGRVNPCKRLIASGPGNRFLCTFTCSLTIVLAGGMPVCRGTILSVVGRYSDTFPTAVVAVNKHPYRSSLGSPCRAIARPSTKRTEPETEESETFFFFFFFPSLPPSLILSYMATT